MCDFKDLEFLAGKSKEMIEKQVSAFRQKNTYAGTIMGMAALFIPFFLSGMNDSYFVIQLLSIIPVVLMIWAILIMLSILRTQPLDVAFKVEKFNELINEKYENILLYEIGANTSSFIDNRHISEKANNKYNFGVKLTIAALLLSVSLLLINKFYKPEIVAKPIKVELINNKNDGK